MKDFADLIHGQEYSHFRNDWNNIVIFSRCFIFSFFFSFSSRALHSTFEVNTAAIVFHISQSSSLFTVMYASKIISSLVNIINEQRRLFNFTFTKSNAQFNTCTYILFNYPIPFNKRYNRLLLQYNGSCCSATIKSCN